MTRPTPPARTLHNVSLAERTTLQVGGLARHWLQVHDAAQTAEALLWARSAELPVWLLGGGSNVVIADTGLPGLVLQMAQSGWQVLEESSDILRVRVGAGVVWDELVAWSVERGCGGIECLSGIPGLVGAAPVQNIGAYGQEVADVIERVEVVERETGTLRTLGAAECAFSYRDSLFKRQAERHVVCAVHLRLQPEGAPNLRHGPLAEAMGGVPLPAGAAGLSRLREAVLRVRRDKAMVVDPADPDSRSAGSFFTNPVVSRAEADAVAQRLLGALATGEVMPSWTTGDRVKLSAAWLIERCGMVKGYGDGPVGLSRRHTLALVNRGGATAADVLRFSAHVASRVEAACGVRLEREPVLLGF